MTKDSYIMMEDVDVVFAKSILLSIRDKTHAIEWAKYGYDCDARDIVESIVYNKDGIISVPVGSKVGIFYIHRMGIHIGSFGISEKELTESDEGFIFINLDHCRNNIDKFAEYITSALEIRTKKVYEPSFSLGYNDDARGILIAPLMAYSDLNETYTVIDGHKIFPTVDTRKSKVTIVNDSNHVVSEDVLARMSMASSDRIRGLSVKGLSDSQREQLIHLHESKKANVKLVTSGGNKALSLSNYAAKDNNDREKNPSKISRMKLEAINNIDNNVKDVGIISRTINYLWTKISSVFKR